MRGRSAAMLPASGRQVFSLVTGLVLSDPEAILVPDQTIQRLLFVLCKLNPDMTYGCGQQQSRDLIMNKIYLLQENKFYCCRFIITAIIIITLIKYAHAALLMVIE